MFTSVQQYHTVYDLASAEMMSERRLSLGIRARQSRGILARVPGLFGKPFTTHAASIAL